MMALRYLKNKTTLVIYMSYCHYELITYELYMRMHDDCRTL
ncbi:MAG: hypothetical protein V4628_08070 [Pseudomonadota bacterium]